MRGEEKGKEALKGLQCHTHWRKGQCLGTPSPQAGPALEGSSLLPHGAGSVSQAREEMRTMHENNTPGAQ